MRSFLTILAVAAILTGLLWIGQGLGLVHWPRSSFMLDQRPWAWRGAVLVVVGVLLMVRARRRRR